MGFEYLSSGGLLESGASAAGIYFFIEIFCQRVKTAEEIISKLKMTPAFKKRYQNNINNNYDILYNSISFQQFSALGREGMVKYISKSLIALAKNGVIKTIKPYL